MQTIVFIDIYKNSQRGASGRSRHPVVSHRRDILTAGSG